MQRKRVLCSSWILNECHLSCKIVKNCRIIGFNRAKKNKILSEVSMIKKGSHSIAFTWDVMRKSMFKRLVYTPPDSSPRFTCKVNLSNTKNRAWFFISASLLDRGMVFLGVQIRLFTRCKICFTLGLSNYFSLKSLSLCLKSHMNVPWSVDYKFIVWFKLWIF